jgi:hypothetical protein
MTELAALPAYSGRVTSVSFRPESGTFNCASVQQAQEPLAAAPCKLSPALPGYHRSDPCSLYSYQC